MIEKPKRPNKIPNQDNKQPQTIQELIRRYDLDNTKIYDFLDELVNKLNVVQPDIKIKLIYDKVVEDADENGFDITGITLKEGKMYKISVDGSLIGNYIDSVNNLKMEFNDEEPAICRNWFLGSEKGEVINVYSTTNYLRILRAFNGFGAHAETEICYREGCIRAICNFAGYGDVIENSVNTKITTMLGRYTGDITKIHVSTTEPEGKVKAGTKIKIFEMP
jgi:hypothetical protein